MSVLSTAKPASDVRPLKALFFGPSKSGKTTLAATTPKALILDTEGGTMSVSGTDADVIRITDWSTFESVVKELMLTTAHGYESVVLDSVTMLQEIAAVDAKLLEAINDPKADPRQAYGKMGAKVRYKILQLNNLPLNVIFTAQLRERDAEDLSAGQYPLTPDVQPAILRVLMAAPDVIARTTMVRVGATTKDVERRVIFGPETRSQVGHRLPVELPYEATGLTIPKLIAMSKKGSK